MIPLSILGLAPVTVGSTPAQTFANTLDLARHAERLGYRRFWLAEAHRPDELMLTANIFDHSLRLRSFELAIPRRA